ncbi:MAG: hypothetical protein QM582_07475 [Micropruina sp.]|uniref:hypothetical protein n=1 Tax=Micropruina sp. TaxID=2737536 RepID=UPI0039E63F24
MNWVEVIGYVASALIVLSLTMTSVVRLRLLSMTGGLIFVVYGAMLPSVPIIVTNAAVAGVNIWFLRRELGPQRAIGAVPIEADAPFLQDFLRAHADDIRRGWPGFVALSDEDVVLLLMRDGLPAGVLAGRRDGAVLRLTIDYVMAAYRDSRIAAWLYTGPGVKLLRDAGFTRVVVRNPTPGHTDYLRQLGFQAVDGDLAKDL